MHFLGTLITALILFCACAAYLFLTLGSYDAQDRSDYEKLILDQSGAGEGKTYTSRQQRVGLQKDVLFTANGSRLHLRLQSASAELALNYHDGQTDAVENMNDAVCYMQEELFYRLPDGREATRQQDGRLLLRRADPKDAASWLQADNFAVQTMQVVRQAKAATACYYYDDDLLAAREVALSRYIAAGHSIEQAVEQLEPLMNASAGSVEFTPGDNISLSENACIEHSFGRFCADQMVLHLPHEKGSGSFGLLQMRGHVSLSFKDGGHLSCVNADIDSPTFSGTFVGSAEQDVVYAEQLRGKRAENGVQVPLTIKSPRMSVRLAGHAAEAEGRSKHCISEMTAGGLVTVNYNDDFIVVSDHAVYMRAPEGSDAKQAAALSGLITMRAGTEDGRCQVSNQSGDVIKASEIRIDTDTKKLTFLHPKGALRAKADGEEDQAERVDFSADLLVWDESSGVLLLKDNVEVNQKAMGRLETSKELRFFQTGTNGRKMLRSIETIGDTVLTCRDEDKNLCHTLACSGPVKVDHVKLETRLYAVCDLQGAVPEGNQIFFKDAYGEIYADRALVKYAMDDQTPILRKIILAGNVRIISHKPAEADEEAAVLQYALADRVDYIPHTKEMIFKALYQGHRVLFFDKANNLQVSAPALKVTRDKAAKQETVQGMGDVRFSFIESEFQQLRQRFLLESSGFANTENSSEGSYESSKKK